VSDDEEVHRNAAKNLDQADTLLVAGDLRNDRGSVPADCHDIYRDKRRADSPARYIPPAK
jgi:hypothetical protein